MNKNCGTCSSSRLFVEPNDKYVVCAARPPVINNEAIVKVLDEGNPVTPEILFCLSHYPIVRKDGSCGEWTSGKEPRKPFREIVRQRTGG